MSSVIDPTPRGSVPALPSVIPLPDPTRTHYLMQRTPKPDSDMRPIMARRDGVDHDVFMLALITMAALFAAFSFVPS